MSTNIKYFKLNLKKNNNYAILNYNRLNIAHNGIEVIVMDHTDTSFSAEDFTVMNESQGTDEAADSVTDSDGAVVFKKNGKTFYCLTIIGQIEGHYILPPQNKTTKYEHLIPKLVAIEEKDEIDGLLIVLNTVGGDIEAGLAIAELIAGMRKPTVSLVLGGGHSIGVPLAVAAKKSFIAKSATMTLHPVRMSGTVLGVQQQLNYFQNIQERIVGFVAENSSVAPECFRELMLHTGELVMDLGTVLNGERAVREGLIDAVGSLRDALRALEEMAEKTE